MISLSQSSLSLTYIQVFVKSIDYEIIIINK